MARDSLKLTRDQLAKFLTDHEQIKQFERLFRVVEDQVADNAVTEVTILAGDAMEKANQALSSIESIKQDTAVNIADAASKGLQALDGVEALKQIVQMLATAPRTPDVTLNEVVDVNAVNPANHYWIRFDKASNIWKAVPLNDLVTVTTSQQLTDAYRTAMVTTSGLTVTLPQATADIVGDEWTVLLNVVGNVTIAPDTGDALILPTTDTTITLYNKGDSLTFRCLNATTWGMV